VPLRDQILDRDVRSGKPAPSCCAAPATPTARAAYVRAIALSANAVERAELERRRAALT
jgi:predicted RNA polymerase sigma factor